MNNCTGRRRAYLTETEEEKQTDSDVAEGRWVVSGKEKNQPRCVAGVEKKPSKLICFISQTSSWGTRELLHAPESHPLL